MEEVLFFTNRRPQSLPVSLPNTSPTSPVASCCSCGKYNSKSTNEIFRTSSAEFAGASKTKKTGSKLSWSVLKNISKIRTDNSNEAKNDNVLSEKNLISNGNCSRSISWTFSSGKDDRDEKAHMKKHCDTDSSSSLIETTIRPAITPTYQTTYSLDLSTSKKHRNLCPKRKDDYKIDASTENHQQSELNYPRIHQLKKQHGLFGFEDVFRNSDVPRSPGPLDGSLYAQIKKKKRSGRNSKMSLLSAKRGYHSAEEVSYIETIKNDKNTDVFQKSTSVLQNANHFLVNDESSDDIPNKEKSLYRVSAESSSSIAARNSVDQINSINLIENVGGTGPLKRSRERNTKSQNCVDSLEISNVEEAKVEIVEIVKDNVLNVSDANNEAETAPFNNPNTSESAIKNGLENTEHNSEDINKKTNVNTRTSSLSSNNSADMRPQAKKQLTKEEVQEAVALINECLSDQQLRSAPLAPEDAQLNFHENTKPSPADSSEVQVDLSIDVPQSSPALPNYTSEEANRIFADKSSEYALPVRDIVQSNVQTRTARIRVQGKTFSNSKIPKKYLDHVNNNNAFASEQSTDYGKMLDSNASEKRPLNSIQGSFGNVHHDLSREKPISSDIDSGVESSTLNMPFRSDAKPNFVPVTKFKSCPSSSQDHLSDRTNRSSTKFSTEISHLIQSATCDKEVEEDDEEKRVREEIENTQKRLAWLQNQQNKIKKEKEEKHKSRNSDVNLTSPNLQTPGVKFMDKGTTLPGHPNHGFQKTTKAWRKEMVDNKPSAEEQKDVDELLRSVQDSDFIGSNGNSKPQEFHKPKMISATLPTRSHRSYTTPSHIVGQSNNAKNENLFTPAYAHPMHQPQHMNLYHYQHQNHQESRRKSSDDKWSTPRNKNEIDENKNQINLQEKRRDEERARQQQFEREFEQKQKQLTKHNRIEDVVQPIVTPHNTATNTLQRKASNPFPKSTESQRNLDKNKRNSLVQIKSEELQSQLDELDRYIALLSQNTGASVPSNAATQLQTSQPEVNRRRSYSINIERKMDLSIPKALEKKTSSKNSLPPPPKPPSRTRSSFESVSRRLSHGFELAQILRQNSVEKEMLNLEKDDDVFQGQPIQPSFPPQTRHTRPIQQQIVGNNPTYSKGFPQKVNNVEQRLSPQLFLAMSVNPGARPVEEIHSYKEDLDPSFRVDVADGSSCSTPGFPVSPSTPYTNNTSNAKSPLPAGLTSTPLSALGLKSSSRNSSGTSEGQEPTSGVSSTPRDANGFPSSFDIRPEQKFGGSSMAEIHSSSRLEKKSNPSNHVGYHDVSSQKLLRDNSLTSPKSTLLSNPSHDSGYADANHHLQQPSSNGWTQNSQRETSNRSDRGINFRKEPELKSPWVHSGSSSPHSSSSGIKNHGNAFSYPSASGDRSSSASRSLTGSNDSLLSEESSSSHPHFAYQQDRMNGSHPSLPQKNTSQRNSASSTRSSSTGGSGYLAGTSQASPHSAGSPSSSAAGQYNLTMAEQRRESQFSSYDRQGHRTFFDEGSRSTPMSGRTSSSSVSDVERLTDDVSNSSLSGSTPKFIKDTTSYWYKAGITREQAIAMLRDRPPGSFIVRDSRCYPGAFGLAIKVHQVPAAFLASMRPGADMQNELVRHFLIEPSTRGVKLKGCANEPVFGSLSALIYQHSITPIALPCRLVIPTENQEVPQLVQPGRAIELPNSASELLKQGAACNVLYLSSVDTESLTGPQAIERAMRDCITNKPQLKTSVVHFKVSPQGITLTDNARKIFFRRHYPTATVTYCGMDPKSREPQCRRWDASQYRGPVEARVFGFVAKKPGSSVDNVCHLFAELDLDQPAPAVVNFVSKVLIGSS